MESKKAGRERNVWKITSVVFIALFVIILLWSMLSLRPRYDFSEPTQEQIDMAESIVAQDLQSMGDSIDNYEVSVTDRMIGFMGRHEMMDGMPGMRHGGFPDEMSMRNLQISLRNNSTGYLYIVNMDSERVMMRSFTEWFDE